MSWNQRKELLDQIEQLVEDPQYPLDDLLMMKEIKFAINQRKPKLIYFLSNHILDLFDRSFSNTYSDEIKQTSFSILVGSTDIKNKICHSTDFIQYFLNFYKDGNTNKDEFYITIQNFVSNCGIIFFQNFPNCKSYMKEFLTDLKYSTCYEFFVYLFSWRYDEEVPDFLMSIDVDEMLYELIKSADTIISLRAMNLLVVLLIDEQSGSPIITKLSNIEQIKEIFELALRSTINEFSESAFNYIILLSNQCDDNDEEEEEENNEEEEKTKRIKTYKKSTFQKIIELLTQNIQELCNYVQKDHSFQGNKRYAVELITTVISIQDNIEPYILNFADFLLRLFLELKTNSFLHLSYFAFFQTITKIKSFNEYIIKNDYMNVILNVLKNKDNVYASYWGHITQIIEILRHILKKEKVKTSDEWNNMINEELMPKLKLLAQNDMPYIQIVQ